MKILYEKLLLEDIDAVKKVFMNRFPDMSEEEFNEIIEIDPTYKKGSNSVGKYGKWLLGLYKKDNPLDRPFFEDIHGLLSLYDDYKNDRTKEIEKDINRFKSIDELADAVRNVDEAELSARQKERELRNAYKDAKLIFSDDMWQIWIPETYAASCTLGKGTEWCTADSRSDYYYNDYTSQGPLYVFINKQNPKEKYQLHVETESFMDEYDDEADLEDVLDTDDKLREFVEEKIGIDNFALSEDVRNVMEAIDCSSNEARTLLDRDRVWYIPDVDSEIELFQFLEREWGWDMDEYYADTIDYEELGYNLSKREYTHPEYGNIISAGEYWCNDENADYEEIGRACVDDIGMYSDTVWRYIDEEEALENCMYNVDYTFTTDGCVIINY